MNREASSHAGAVPNTNVLVPLGRMGMWWFLASEVLVFGGLIFSYVLCRWRTPAWGEEAAHTLFPVGALNTLVLLTSSFMVVQAHIRATRGDGKGAAKFLGITLVLGLLFLAFKGYEYSHEIHQGLIPSKSTFWSFYYLMTGLHGLHVLAGLVAMTIILLAARKGRNLHRVEVIGMYWHFVDVVWIFLFPLLYLVS